MKPFHHTFFLENGMILLSTMLLLGALALASSTVFLMAATEIKIGGNYKRGARTYYGALAGCEEARARLRTGGAHPILDAHQAETKWKAYLGDLLMAKDMGFDPKNSLHVHVDTLQRDNGCVVEIRHQTDAFGKIVLWGDEDGNGTNEKNTKSGENVYCINSTYTDNDFKTSIQIEAAKIPPIPVPGVLYVKTMAAVLGSNTIINGRDGCGNRHIPGIVVTESVGAVDVLEGAEVMGYGGKKPNVRYNGKVLNLRKIIDANKKKADYAYEVNAARIGSKDAPGPGDGWGSPNSGGNALAPSTCKKVYTVHYKTGGTYVHFANGVRGCGLLLVDGDLEVSGDFTWNGLIVVTGSVLFTDGGDKYITGAVMAGESAVIGGAKGQTSIVYCSKAIEAQTQKKPLRILSWKE